MKSLSGIVTNSVASVRTSDVSASETHDCEFSIGDVEVVFSSSRSLDIAVGDMVVAAGGFKANRMTAFAIHDLSTNERRNSGVISNLFVAVFVTVLGLFGFVITSVFLAPFSYAILAMSGVSAFYLLYRSSASLAACILVWHRRRHLAPTTPSTH
ncbi:MAG: hypothetical protein ACRCXD_04425 [Luteolibacter sp.]